MATPFQYDVFLSHSSKDKAVVRTLAERLRQDGLKVWFDEWVLKPGDPIQKMIDDGLETSRVLVLCMSANAFGSDWAQLEAGTFRFRDPLNRERRFIPLRLDDAPIKGSLGQFLYLDWRPADREQEHAKLLAACRGETELSSTNRPYAPIQPQLNPAVPTKLVHVEHSGSGDIVMGNKTVGRPRVNFTPGPQHISPETARKLYELVKDIVERLTISGGNVQKAFQRVWGDFNAHFSLTTYKELPREKTDEGIAYLRQWRASKNSRLRNADPEKFRTAQLKGIWPRSKSLGFTDADLYAFASKKLKLPDSITSLNELGNQQLARLNRFLIYEERKLKQRRSKDAPNEIKSDADDTMPNPPPSRPIGEVWSGLRGLLQQAYSTQTIKGIVGQAGLATAKIEYLGTYKTPYLNAVDGLVRTMGDDTREQFVLGCIREILVFERTKAENLSRIGIQFDDQVLQNLRRVLANFGHDIEVFHE
ncbi:MAG: TIR domain-containing protein [Verrucomicrobiota bacterium]